MTVNINVITHSSNKTLDVIDVEGNFIIGNYSNEVITLPYDNSYIIYTEPVLKEIGFSGFIDLSNSIFTGVTGYIWIILIAIIFYYLIKGVKNHVK